MKNVDYSQQLTESEEDGCWKTAQEVEPSDFAQVTRRLRYQARQLGLDITIQTDRQNNTVSFRTWKCRL